jgi:uncharacterized phage protein (TIGR01671 family)
MSREIKFRAFNTLRGMMCHDVGIAPPTASLLSFTSDGIYVRPDYDKIILMQFTGLLDADGTEIYEGDIVVVPGEYIWFDDGEPNYRGVVDWIFSQWQVVAYCVNPNKRGISDGINEGLNDAGWGEGEKSHWKVIGNIHENPELLP